MKAMKAMKLPNDMKQTSKAMKSMKASSSNTKNKTMKAMKGKAMDKAKLAMGQWAIRCQKPGCTSWVWLRAPAPRRAHMGARPPRQGPRPSELGTTMQTRFTMAYTN